MFNLLIVVVDFSNTDLNNFPLVEHHYLKSTSNEDGQVIVYNSKDPDIPIRREKIREIINKDIMINNQPYRLIGSRYSILDFIYEETPILSSVNELIKERLKLYLEKKKVEL